MRVICKNHRHCEIQNICPHAKSHEFTTGQIGFINNCQGRGKECVCVEEIKEKRKIRLKKLNNIFLK